MKSIFKVLVFLVSIFSCTQCENPDITLKGNIDGTISNFSKGTFDKIKCFNEAENHLIGESELSSLGRFSFSLSIPVCDEIGSDEDIVVSDPTTKVAKCYMYAYKNGEYVGEIIKCNEIYKDNYKSAGAIYTQLIYADRPCTCSGSIIGYHSETIIDFSFKKGWNEVSTEVISYNSMLTKYKHSTNIPSNLKWFFIVDE
jgi:hypothetical protein